MPKGKKVENRFTLIFCSHYKDHTNSDVEKKFSNPEKEEEEEDWDDEVSSDSSTVVFSLSTGFVAREDASVLEEDYYKLNLPSDKISIIDTIAGLQQLSKELFSVI